MEELRRKRAELIKKLREANNIAEQYKLKREIDFIESQMSRYEKLKKNNKKR